MRNKDPLKKFFTNDDIVKKGMQWSLIFWLISIVFLLISFYRLPPVVPLFYSLIRGESQLAPKLALLLLPIFNTISLAIHFFVTRRYFQTDRTLSRLASLSSTLISFMFALGIIHVIIIVL